MKKQEKEITQRYEKAKKEFLEAREEFNKISDERKLEKLKKKYENRYFKSKDDDVYYYIKEISNTSYAIGHRIAIDINCIRIDSQLYINTTSILKKSNKLEFTNALNVAMDRLKTLKNQ